MITFIVTTYNLEDWLLRRCLSSIVGQGLARDQYEVIVVDDESVVSPRHVVDEFTAQAHITLHIQPHARQGAARNLALRHAKGEWIQFVDGDDYLLAGTMLPVLKAAEERALDLLMFGFREVSCHPEHNEPLDRWPKVAALAKSRRGKARISCSVARDNAGCFAPLNMTREVEYFSFASGDAYMSRHNLFGACWPMLFRRALLDDAQFGAPLRFTEGIYIEDEEFVTHLVWRAQRMARVDTVVYAYYQRAGSTVHSQSRAHTDELFRSYFVVLEHLLDFAASVHDKPHEGLTRKVRFLAIDVLRRSLREPDWKVRWRESVQQLRSLGLYPIPPARYSMKYSAFRLLAKCGVGQSVLRFLEK